MSREWLCPEILYPAAVVIGLTLGVGIPFSYDLFQKYVLKKRRWYD